MYERETAIGKITAVCRECQRREIANLVDEWGKAKGMDFSVLVPDQDVDEIIAILVEEVRYVA